MAKTLAEIRQERGIVSGTTPVATGNSLYEVRAIRAAQKEQGNIPTTVQPARYTENIAEGQRLSSINNQAVPNISQTPEFKQEEKSNEYQKQFNIKLEQAGMKKIGGKTNVAGYLPTKNGEYGIDEVNYTLPFYVPEDTVKRMNGIEPVKKSKDGVLKDFPMDNAIGKRLGVNTEKIDSKPDTNVQNAEIPYEQQADYVIKRYFEDDDYRKDYDAQIGQLIANQIFTQEQIKSGEIDKQANWMEKIQNFLTSGANVLLAKIPTTGLIPVKSTDESVRIPTKTQMFNADMSKTPTAQILGSMAGSLANAIILQGAAISALDKGLSLTKVTLEQATLANARKIAIGVATQIPQSILKQESFKDIWENKGDITLEVVRNGYSWYLGGNLERAMDNQLGKLVTSEATLTGLRKVAYAVLTKAPITYRAITESAETMGQLFGSVALGQTEYLTDPSYFIQNFSMDMALVVIGGLMGTDGTNKAAMARDIRKMQTEFNETIKTSKNDPKKLAVTRAHLDIQFDDFIYKYQPKNQQLLQTLELGRNLMELDSAKIQAETMTLEEAGRLSQIEQAANEDIAYQQTKELSGQDAEVAGRITKEAMVKNPHSRTTSDAVQNSEFIPERVDDRAVEFAKSISEISGSKFMFGRFDDPEVNDFRGVYVPEIDTILINSSLDSVEVYKAILSHEMLHSMRAKNPKAYNILVSMIDEKKLNTDYAFNDKIEQAKNTKNQGDDFKVLDYAKEEYLGDLFMKMYEIDPKFFEKALKKDKGIIESLLNNIKRMRTIKANTTDKSILSAFKTINGLGQAMESALYKFANEPKVKSEPVAKVETPVAKNETVMLENAKGEKETYAKYPDETVPPWELTPLTKPKTKQPSTASQKSQQATSIAKEGKVPSETAKTSTTPTAEDVKYSQDTTDYVTKGVEVMESARKVEQAAKDAGDKVTEERMREQIGEGAYDKMIKSSKMFEQKQMDELNDSDDAKVLTIHGNIVTILSSGKHVDSEGFAKAIALIKYYLNKKEADKAEEIYSRYIPAMSEQGRGLQAAKLLAAATPHGYVKVIQAMLDRLNISGAKKYNNKFREKWVNVELKPEEKAELLATNMNDVEMRDYLLLKIGQRIAGDMPHNMGDYLNAWAKLSMLSSFRTHARNTFSNLLYVPTQELNNAIGAFLEMPIKIGTSAETMPWSASESVKAIGDGIKRIQNNGKIAAGSEWSNQFTDKKGKISPNGLLLTPQSVDMIKNTNPNRPDQVEALRAFLKKEISGQLKGEKSAAYFSKQKILDTTIDNWVTNNKGIDTATKTHSFATKLGAFNKNELQFKIKEQFLKEVKPKLSRLNTDTVSTRNVFGVEVLPFGKSKKAYLFNKWAKLNSWALNDVEDVPFYQIAYRNSLYRYMKANNQTEITKVASEYAMSVAREATYKQDYSFIRAIEGMKKIGYGGGALVDTIMPFTRTPINIIVRGLVNSPLGLLKGIAEMAWYIGGKSTAFEVNGKIKHRGDVELLRKGINDVAAGIGGTAVAVLGYMAFNAGFITGPPEDDYKLADYRKQVGEAPYAFHIGNKYFPLDWIQPTITPLVTGIAMAASMLDKDIEPDGIARFTNAGTAGLNVVLELPFLSTLQDLFGNQSSTNKDDNANKIYAATTKMTNAYISQRIPTIVGDVNRVFDNKQRTTYTPKDDNADFKLDVLGFESKLPYSIRASIRNIASKVAPYLLDARVDIWGNELKRSPTAVGNAFQSMLLPFLATQDKKTAVDKELIRLSGIDSSDKSMFPYVSPKSIKSTFGGVSTEVPLNSAQYAGTWQRTAGQTAFKTINTLIMSSAYRGVDDSLKSKAYSMANGYANVKADSEILREKGLSGVALTSEDDRIAEKLIELYISGKKIDGDTEDVKYPRKVEGNTIAYNGKTYGFTQSQRNSYESLLGSNTRTALSKVFSSTAYTNAKPDEQKDLVDEAISDSKEKTTKSYMMANMSKLTVKK